MDASLTEKMRPAGAMPLGCRRPPDRGLRGGYRDRRRGGHRHNLHDGPARPPRAGPEQLRCAGPEGRRYGGSGERPRDGPGRCLNAGPGWPPRVHLGEHHGTRSGRGHRRRRWPSSRAASADLRRSPPGPSASPVPQPRSPTSSLNTTQTSEEGRSTTSGATLFKHVRRRPTLPRGPPRSTIGAEGLNFRVRNGTGCFPFAITAETLLRCHRPEGLLATVSREPHSGREIKWSRSQATRPISTGQLHTLPCFHLRPINPVV